MKRVIVICVLLVTGWQAYSQSWNPFVCQGIITPLLPGEFGGTGQASFDIGNTGSSPILFDHLNSDNNLKVVITLSEGNPDKNNPLAAIGGSWKSTFDWSYDALQNTILGRQKRDIPGYSRGTISLDYRVNSNTPRDAAFNGFKIALTVPSYIQGSNTTQDDRVSSYTFTSASDFGDAPDSYGEAKHNIDLTKNPETGQYNRFIVLGTAVDPETESLFSSVALKDDTNGSDDEDGVNFPLLVTGKEAIISVVATVYGDGFGFLNAWFDWNGDGDFLDQGERMAGTPLAVYATGTYSVKVQIPAVAVTSRPVFARFRLGANKGPSGGNDWGEVEDYQVMIRNSDLDATLTKVDITSAGMMGAIDLNVTGGMPPYTFLWNNGATTQNVGGLDEGTYSVIIRDAAGNMITMDETIIRTNESSLVDVDEYGRIINSKTENRGGFQVWVYPNPVSDFYHLSFGREGKYLLELSDVFGKTVYTGEVVIVPGINVVRMSRGTLISGNYVLKVTDKAIGLSQTFKLVMLQK